MYVVRNVFHCKPGKASDLAARARKTIPLMQQEGVGQARVLIDVVSSFWTVVFEIEVPDLATYEKATAARPSNPEMMKIMEGYMDLIEHGHREVFRVVE